MTRDCSHPRNACQGMLLLNIGIGCFQSKSLNPSFPRWIGSRIPKNNITVITCIQHITHITKTHPNPSHSRIVSTENTYLHWTDETPSSPSKKLTTNRHNSHKTSSNHNHKHNKSNRPKCSHCLPHSDFQRWHQRKRHDKTVLYYALSNGNTDISCPKNWTPIANGQVPENLPNYTRCYLSDASTSVTVTPKLLCLDGSGTVIYETVGTKPPGMSPSSWEKAITDNLLKMNQNKKLVVRLVEGEKVAGKHTYNRNWSFWGWQRAGGRRRQLRRQTGQGGKGERGEGDKGEKMHCKEKQ